MIVCETPLGMAYQSFSLFLQTFNQLLNLDEFGR